MQPIRRHWLSSLIPFAILGSSVGIAVLITMIWMGPPSRPDGQPLYVRGVHDPIAYGTFRTENLLVDQLASIAPSNALENPNRVMNIGGPWQNIVNVGSDNSEIFLQTLKGSGHPSTSDVCGVVVRNQVTFDTSGSANQACAVYGEVTSTVSTGSGALVNYAVRGNAICGSGVTNCYSFFGDHGAVRADDGAFFGPEQVTGSFLQQDGDVSLNFGGSGGGGSGTTQIKGDTHIISHSLVVDGTGEFGGNLTADQALRVNGNANLAGSPSSIVFLNSINSSGLPIPVTNTLAFPIEHDTGPGAADPTIQLSVVTGTGTALTLADGTKDGQIKSFSIFSGTGSITPAHGAAYSWTTTPASVMLQWDASNTRWVSTALNSVTGSAPTGTGSANQTAKWSAPGTLTNGWASDNGTTWGSAGVFTINESSGSASANGDIQTQGALKLATATWTQGASAPVGACTTGSLYSVTSNISPAFYVCASSAWLAVAGGTLTGTGTIGDLSVWASSTSLGNYAGSACGSGTFANAIGSNGGLTCGSASGGAGTVTSITCGTGLTCTPGSPITTSGTIAVTAVAGALTITNATQSGGVNLSTVGSGQVDWLFNTGAVSPRTTDSFAATLTEKLQGAAQLVTPGVDALGATGTPTTANGATTFSSTAGDTTDGLALSSAQCSEITSAAVNTGFRFVAPAKTTSQVLRIYDLHKSSTVVCTAHLTDGSSADQTTSSTAASGTTVQELQTVTFTASTTGAWLVVNCQITATTTGPFIGWCAEVLSAS